MFEIEVLKVRMLCAQRTITLKELANLAGINPQNLSVILHRGTCRPVTAGRIASALNIPVEQIVKECR